MPRRSENADFNRGGRRSTRMENSKTVSYAEMDVDPMDVEDVFDGENPASTDESDEDLQVDGESEEEEVGRTRRSRRVAKSSSAKAEKVAASKREQEAAGQRRSARSTKFTSSMAEPTGIKDLIQGQNEYIKKSRKQKTSRESSTGMEEDDFFDDEDEDEDSNVGKSSSRRKRGGNVEDARDSLASIGNGSPHKSPARRHAKARLSIRHDTKGSPDSDEYSVESMESVDEDEEEPLKIQRIIAARTETKRNWSSILKDINTSEVECGSRWFQQEKHDEDANDDTFEERFLVKWSDMSFLHCSWETQDDLVDQIDGAKTYLTTFFRKSENGLLFSADERCDGDFYDPAFTQIDRILEVQWPEDFDPTSADEEDKFTDSDFGIVMDKADPDYEDGTGRQFLIKWGNSPYSESTYEFERDLIQNDIEYKDAVKDFLRRNDKPTKKEIRKVLRSGEEERRRMYKVFGEKSNMEESQQEEAIEKFQRELEEHVYKNEGQLRDYQAEGVTWMIANYVNRRSCILADEMGLGKTLQTAAFCTLLTNKLNRAGIYLIIAPLSTLSHWQREFRAWTEMNVIIYHGSADDRQLIRELEFAYECDRPKQQVGFNQLYLRKCGPRKFSSSESPWMVNVVITTPEMLVADDSAELSAVSWDLLVVDEAHRLKNHNSKLAVTLRDKRFTFEHKLLLTGTPIQNDVREFWTLLNFIDPDGFDDCEDFMEKYGEMKSKENVDELHEEIRPYILRRLKEDVEKSVPPKEETLIEVELTLAQKQYYRALYEKNVKFLLKNKAKALDGPSLNNLAMQLRKCCNHLFLLNGVEEEFRANEKENITEGDFLARASGKLVLLDKLLPRLQAEGHRVLLFSQFKIMLDILEDYLDARRMKFERIDGSITGHKRQQAIDRFQAPSTEGKEGPFIMMLTTRAGGVGINLTAADTCIIFDSDWNPQQDIQAQARCHRIGQTKSVKIYRLLTRKTYEMQMFHMSSMKMGLDQAVLKGFESGASGEGSLSKEEVEKLLRHGAYDIFNEDKAGTAEAESNDFVQQDIDSILERRARTVVHENTGSQSNAAGGTFSKARFKVTKTPDTQGKARSEDIDIEDPDFWKKMVGEGNADEGLDDLTSKPRKRAQMNYSETQYTKVLDAHLRLAESSSDEEIDSESSDDEAHEDPNYERGHWGGSLPKEWKKDHFETLLKAMLTFGYGSLQWEDFLRRLQFGKKYDDFEIKRMCWSILFFTLLQTANDEAVATMKREEKAAEKKLEDATEEKKNEGGMLAQEPAGDLEAKKVSRKELEEKSFANLCKDNADWLGQVLNDAVAFAACSTPRGQEVLDRVLYKKSASHSSGINEISSIFTENVWPSLKNRGWKAELVLEGDASGQTRYIFEGKKYTSFESVLSAAQTMHPELSNMVEKLLELVQRTHLQSAESLKQERVEHLALRLDTINCTNLKQFLLKYAPMQLLVEREKNQPVRLSRKLLTVCSLLQKASSLARKADKSGEGSNELERLASILVIDKRTALPHPSWTPRHDAVLIRAVLKHGWIDQDASCRAIRDDPSVKWGYPFDSSSAPNSADAETASQYFKPELAKTADRAASFLNKNQDLVDEIGGFNKDLVTRTFALECHSYDESDTNAGHDGFKAKPYWIVDEGTLRGTANVSARLTEAQDAEDLPPKKDLVKRAKTVLTRSTEHHDTKKNSEKPSSSSAFAVLDQCDQCNTLVAAMLRSVLKAPKKSLRQAKILLSLAIEETRTRAKSISASSSSPNFNAEDKSSVAAKELYKVAEHLELVKRNIVKSTRQSKNVLRVILGEEPHKPHSSDESIFPVERVSLSSLQKSESKRAPRSSDPLKPVSKPSGERAIELAVKTVVERSGGGPGYVSRESESWTELTEIETMVISTVCSVGLPIWTKEWKKLLSESTVVSVSPSRGSHSNVHAMSWASFGRVLARLAQKQAGKAAEKLTKSKKDFSKVEQDHSKLEDRAKAEEAVWIAERTFERKEQALIQANEYSSEPEILAKKTIMMLAKFVERMVKNSISPAPRSDYGVGPKVLKWLDREITKWADTFELLDESGRSLGLTAVDFLEELPEEERSNVEVVSAFDKKGCRTVMSQIAMMSRMRSIFVQYQGTELIARVDRAVSNVNATADKWEKEPEQWQPVLQDYLMLQRLLYDGFDNVLESRQAFGQSDAYARVPFKELKLTKGAIQLRANQLVRELHNVEQTGNAFRLLDERRKENAVSAAAAPKRAAPAHGSVQTGLLAFFPPAGVAATRATNQPVAHFAPATVVQPQIIVAVPQRSPHSRVAYDDVEVVSPPKSKREVVYEDVEVVSPPKGKRKEDGKADDEDSPPSAEKKARAS